MAELIWTEPVLSDLDGIADYIAQDKPTAAKAFVQRVFLHIEQLQGYPDSGSPVRELPDSRYRQIVEPPCRIFYRFDGSKIFVLQAAQLFFCKFAENGLSVPAVPAFRLKQNTGVGELRRPASPEKRFL